MKKLFITLFVVLYTIFSQAQWQQDVRITNNTNEDRGSLNNSKWLVSQGDEVHVLWASGAAGVYDLWHTRSTDNGLTWELFNQVTTEISVAEVYASICLSGNVNPIVHVVWSDNRYAPNWEIYYKRSTDGGLTWGIEKRITATYENSQYPSIVASGSTVHLVWVENNQAVYKRSTDGGITWGVASTPISYYPLTSGGYPSISLSGTFIHVVWAEAEDIHYRRSLTDGTSWEPVTRLTNDSSFSGSPSLSVSLQNVNVVWQDYRDGNYEIYYKRSMDGGLNWETDLRLTNSSDVSYSPSIIVSGNIVHTVWYDVLTDYKILYKKSLNSGVIWEGDIVLTNPQGGGAFNPSISAFGTTTHVAWEDTRDANWEIYYKRNPSGNTTNIDESNILFPSEFLLYQNYPNPFNPSTRIQYQVPSTSQVTLKVYDILGNEVAILVNEEKPAGTYEIEFKPESCSKHPASGIFFYQLKSNNYLETKKMILIK